MLQLSKVTQKKLKEAIWYPDKNGGLETLHLQITSFAGPGIGKKEIKCKALCSLKGLVG